MNVKNIPDQINNNQNPKTWNGTATSLLYSNKKKVNMKRFSSIKNLVQLRGSLAS